VNRLSRTCGALLLAGALVTPATPAAAAPTWIPVWQDDFDGAAGTPPDPARWTAQVGGDGWGNSELEYYTASTRNAARDGHGQLVISALEERPPGSTCWYGECRYSSARLTTKDKFAQRYGKIEARMKVPAGKGMWPAFWMMGDDFDSAGWPGCGEIDVMENVASEPDTVYGTLHGPGYFDENGPGGSTRSPDGTPLSAAFHTYGVEWQPNSVSWFLDGARYLTLTPDNIPAGARWVFDHPFFMLLNLAVGGTWPGDPDASTQFPQQLAVDYVHVYRAG
jgi:beta-glucanase (GH16 family)